MLFYFNEKINLLLSFNCKNTMGCPPQEKENLGPLRNRDTGVIN
jgi:hypothetical protein